MVESLNVLINKKNNQLVVFLNRKKLGIKGKNPKKIKINRRNLIF